jgi:hypothetical protein
LSPAPADDRPVVVLTGIDDPTADMVIRHLNAAAVPVVRLDPADFPREVSLSARIGTGRAWSGRIDTGSRQFDPGSVRALWLRRPGRYAFPGMDAATAAYATAQAEAGLGGVLRALPGCLYVNHPAAHQAASVKPVQLDTAARAGFDIPDTLITSDPAVAREFTETHDAVIHKPLGPSLWHPDGDRVFLVGVSDVNAAGLDETVGATAHLFQARIPKTHAGSEGVHGRARPGVRGVRFRGRRRRALVVPGGERGRAVRVAGGADGLPAHGDDGGVPAIFSIGGVPR